MSYREKLKRGLRIAKTKRIINRRKRIVFARDWLMLQWFNVNPVKPDNYYNKWNLCCTCRICRRDRRGLRKRRANVLTDFEERDIIYNDGKESP